ncbi:MAG TPA: type II toxin-antitoxin system VapC family toxin [Terracidiphilus sp.]|nr:type II toxin-antitoxin system VapC family toxin [Terracidiphilus sp.]
MDSSALDSSAILAVIFNEPGSDRVAPLLQGALLSTVNLAEVHTQLLLRGVPADLSWSRILSMGFDVCHFDEEQARIAAELIAKTRPLGLSLGDRSCLALAIQRQAAVYTTDRAWQSLSLGIQIEVIR